MRAALEEEDDVSDPVKPEPDQKDWTWVLNATCDQCGYEAGSFDRSEIGAKIRVNAATWRTLLGSGDIVAKRPPDGDPSSPVWSALEYGVHVRDVYELFGDRLGLMIKKKNPKFRDWDQDRAAIKGKYHEQDPARVAYSLAVAAGALADSFDKLSDEVWSRTAERSDGAAFTVESLGRYLLHDVTHHLADARSGFEQLTKKKPTESEDD
ncbi:MAG: hypothetical protein ACI8TP_004783 [Acidimicrobiales bacterium]